MYSYVGLRKYEKNKKDPNNFHMKCALKVLFKMINYSQIYPNNDDDVNIN